MNFNDKTRQGLYSIVHTTSVVDSRDLAFEPNHCDSFSEGKPVKFFSSGLNPFNFGLYEFGIANTIRSKGLSTRWTTNTETRHRIASATHRDEVLRGPHTILGRV